MAFWRQQAQHGTARNQTTLLASTNANGAVSCRAVLCWLTRFAKVC